MKLTVKLDPTFGQLIKTIKTKVNNLIYRWFKKPYNDYVEKRLEEKRIKKIHEEFERKFNMTPNQVINLMQRSDASGKFLSKPTIKMTDAEYKAFLLEELRKSAMSLNEMKPFIKASMFYDPEISDIHNESLEDIKGPSLKEFIAKDSSESMKMLRQQEKKYGTIEITKKPTINSYTPPKPMDRTKIFGK